MEGLNPIKDLFEAFKLHDDMFVLKSDILAALDYSSLDPGEIPVSRFISALSRSASDRVDFEELKSLLEVPEIPCIDDRKAAYLTIDAKRLGSFDISDLVRVSDELCLGIEIDPKLKYERKRWKFTDLARIR